MKTTVLRIISLLAALAILTCGGAALLTYAARQDTEREVGPAAEQTANRRTAAAQGILCVPAVRTDVQNTDSEPNGVPSTSDPPADEPVRAGSGAPQVSSEVPVKKPEPQVRKPNSPAAKPEEGPGLQTPPRAKAASETSEPPAPGPDPTETTVSPSPETPVPDAEPEPEPDAADPPSSEKAETAPEPVPDLPAEETAAEGLPLSKTPAEPSFDDVPEDRYAGLTLSDEDIELLARLVWLEARGEPYEGQVAVAEVVLNRVLSAEFPDTVYDVIYQRGQFTPASKISGTTPDEEQYRAVADAIEGMTCVLDADALFFSGAPYNSRICAVIGTHYFCRM